MKDTDEVTLVLTLTYRQAKYLRRKLHDCAVQKRQQYKRTLREELQDDFMMLDGLAVYMESKINGKSMDEGKNS